jgi:hypothetical protein
MGWARRSCACPLFDRSGAKRSTSVTIYSGDRGDTLAPKGCSARSTRPNSLIEEPEVVVHEGHQPDLLAHLLHTHLLSGKHPAEVDLAATDADAAAVSTSSWVLRGRCLFVVA